ncbi:MAG: hypothetical protein MUE36_03900 [Acidimicrobiales bacterium]|jgi:hypothetical protein|nr:hypothetical protein [Acidimicrobiales bacterium]
MDTSTNDPQEPTRPGPAWRRRLAVILVVVGAVLSPLAVDALWIKRTVLETDQFVAQLGPLADDPDVQALVAERVSTALIEQADLSTRLEGALPPELQFLDGTLASAGDGLITEATSRVVASDQFAQLWRQALAIAHEEVVNVLTGDTRVVDVQDGTVTLDLSSLRDAVRERISQTGLAQFLPPASSDPLEITLYQSDALASAQSFVELLDVLGFVLPLLVIALFGASIALALDRRRGVFRVGLALTIAMVVHLLALLVGRSFYLDSVIPALPEPAAASIYDLLVTFPRVGTRAMLLVGILLMIGAAVLGPTALAARTRAVVAAAIGRAGTEVAKAEPAGPVTGFVARYRKAFHIAVLVGAALVLFSFERVTPGSLLVLVVVTLVVLAVIQVLATAGASAVGAPDPATSTAAAPSSPTVEQPPSATPTVEQPTAVTVEDPPEGAAGPTADE